MAISKSWGYGTSTDGVTYTSEVINPVSGFALTSDEPTECQLINSAGSIDLGEMVSYRSRTVTKVNSFLDNVNPPAVETGVQYGVRLDEQLALTSSDDPAYREVLPVVVTLQISHPKNGNISTADIDTIFGRLIGACLKKSGGTVSTRFADLMKSALHPTVDGAASS